MNKFLKAVLFAMTTQLASAQTFDVYVGTYTKNSPAKGIYHAVLDASTGSLSEPELVAESPNPSFLAFHPGGRVIYAVVEDADGKVRSFEVSKDGKTLRLTGESPSGGKVPCHLSVDGAGRNLLAANYTDGSVSASLLRPDGSLGAGPSCVIRHEGRGADPRRQTGPHAHSINPSPDGRHFYAADLGLDKIMAYSLDTASGKLRQLSETTLKAASGPRHMAFRADGRVAYAVNELDSTVTVMSRDPETGALTVVQNVSTLPPDFKGTTWCAEVRLHPGGGFLYASNRGHDSIAVFKADPKDGTLGAPAFQCENIKTPRHFNIDPTGSYCVVANQGADNLALFKVDKATGMLEFTGKTVPVGRPVFVGFLPSVTAK